MKSELVIGLATVPPQPENSNVENVELVGLSNMSPPVEAMPEMIFRFGKKTKDTIAISYAEVSPASMYVSADTITTLTAAYRPADFVWLCLFNTETPLAVSSNCPLPN